MEAYHLFDQGSHVFVIFILALLFLYVEEESIYVRKYYVIPSLLVLFLLVLNPFFMGLATHFFSVLRMVRYYWLFPVTVIFAYVAVVLLRKGRTVWSKGVISVLMLGVMVVMGQYMFTDENFAKAENIYKVPDEVVEIADMIEADGNDGVLVPSLETVDTIRQYDANIRMAFGRYLGGAPVEIAQLQETEALNLRTADDVMKKCGYTYILIHKSKQTVGNYEDVGWELLGETDNHFLYKRPGIRVTQYGDASGNQAMFYTVESEGELYVIDGGWTANADQVRNVINEEGGVVKAWFLTHPHPDHMGAFNEIYQDLQGITVEQIYTIDMDYTLYQEYAKEWDDFPTFDTFCKITEGEENLSYLHTGDVLEFAGMKIEIYNAYDDTTIDYSEDLANAGSLVFKICGESESMLFCSDTFGDSLCNKIMDEYGDRIKSSYLQMGHHGNHSVTEAFVSSVQPEAVFFDAPQWLIEGEDYDTQKNIDYVSGIGAEVYTYQSVPNRIVIN